ncbi:hypothetical protein SUDANB120_05440 [Streptomyces sp. enrichment culture]
MRAGRGLVAAVAGWRRGPGRRRSARAQGDDREHRGRRGHEGEGHRRNVVLDRFRGRDAVRGPRYGLLRRRGRRWRREDHGHGRGLGPGGGRRGLRRGRFGRLRDGCGPGRRRLRRGRGSGLRRGRRGRLRRGSGLGRCGGRGGLRRRGGRRLRRARRRRRRAVVAAAVPVAAVALPPPLAVAVPTAVAAAPVPCAVLDIRRTAAVMCATSGGSCGAAAGDGGQADAAPGAAVADRRVGAAIGHGRRGGQGRPQQGREHDQTPGTGSVHPGSMGSRALAHAGPGPGSPERVLYGP